MPIILRKTSISPPNWNEVQDDSEDYIGDPEQIRDMLPQPYRMVNKVFSMILDDIWDVIAEREDTRIAERMRVRPPKYQCAVQMQLHGKACCLSDSKDGRYLFSGLPDGIAAIDAVTQQTISQWEEEAVEITQMHVAMIGVQMYLISTIDDMGIGRLFAFANDKLHLLKVMNDQDNSSSKIIASKCEASSEGDYVGVFLENPSTLEKWLEIHKLPRDNWLRELEAFHAQYVKDASKRSSTPQEEQDVDVGSVTGGDEVKSSTSQKSQSPSGSPRQGVSPAPGGSNQAAYKFSPPTIVLKVRPPQAVSANPQTNPFLASKAVDAGDVIGTGINHMLTNAHLDQRKLVFEHMNEQLIQYLPKEQKEMSVLPHFHFLSSGRMLPIGLEQAGMSDRPTSVAIWWTGGTQLLHYSLLKQAKDLKPVVKEQATSVPKIQVTSTSRIKVDIETSDVSTVPEVQHFGTMISKRKDLKSPSETSDNKQLSASQSRRTSLIQSPGSARTEKKKGRDGSSDTTELEHKPDLVWPYAHTITATATSPCASLLAIGLHNGTVVVWDKYMGIPRRITIVNEGCKITKLHFLNPNICPQDNSNYPPYQTKTSFYVMVVASNSCLSLLNCGMADTSQPIQILPPVDKDDDNLTLVEPFPGIPDVILTVRRDGAMFLRDIVKGHNLCQVVLPQTHSLASPWQPLIAVGGEGLMLYIKGSQKDPEEDYVPNSGLESLFVFQLRSFPTLDRYWRKKREKVPYVVHSTATDRVDALLAYRLADQLNRQARMQQRWSDLRQELDKIREIREANKSRQNMNSAFNVSTITKTTLKSRQADLQEVEV